MENLSRNKTKLILFIILVLLLIIFFPQLSELFMNPSSLLKNSVLPAPLIYSLLMILTILVAPIPSSPLVIIAGALFGPWKAVILTLISATIGSTLAFLIGRFFLRDYFKRNFENNRIYKNFKGKDNKNVAYTVFIFHLMPQVSFDLVSYLAGATGLNIFLYMLITFTAMIPVVLILSFFGAFLEPYKLIVLAILGASALLYAVYHIVKERK